MHTTEWPCPECGLIWNTPTAAQHCTDRDLNDEGLTYQTSRSRVTPSWD